MYAPIWQKRLKTIAICPWNALPRMLESGTLPNPWHERHPIIYYCPARFRPHRAGDCRMVDRYDGVTRNDTENAQEWHSPKYFFYSTRYANAQNFTLAWTMLLTICKRREKGMKYKIIRYFFTGRRITVRTGLTLEQAQAHCNDPETSSQTCTTTEGKRRTKKHGRWFDGYTAEN